MIFGISVNGRFVRATYRQDISTKLRAVMKPFPNSEICVLHTCDGLNNAQIAGFLRYCQDNTPLIGTSRYAYHIAPMFLDYELSAPYTDTEYKRALRAANLPIQNRIRGSKIIYRQAVFVERHEPTDRSGPVEWRAGLNAAGIPTFEAVRVNI